MEIGKLDPAHSRGGNTREAGHREESQGKHSCDGKAQPVRGGSRVESALPPQAVLYPVSHPALQNPVTSHKHTSGMFVFQGLLRGSHLGCSITCTDELFQGH